MFATNLLPSLAGRFPALARTAAAPVVVAVVEGQLVVGLVVVVVGVAWQLERALAEADRPVVVVVAVELADKRALVAAWQRERALAADDRLVAEVEAEGRVGKRELVVAWQLGQAEAGTLVAEVVAVVLVGMLVLVVWVVASLVAVVEVLGPGSAARPAHLQYSVVR